MYFLLGVIWVMICLLIGMYIRSTNKRRLVKVGIFAIIVSYVVGELMLITAIIFS